MMNIVKILIPIFLLTLLSISCSLPMNEPKDTHDLPPKLPDGHSTTELMDVHGAGAQRSDPKSGDPADYPTGFGPQGDVIRIYNMVRCVRGTTSSSNTYPIVDTNQTVFYDDSDIITEPLATDDYYGQDANFTGLTPSYTDNGDGTVTDNNTGLMWRQDPGDKMTYDDAITGASTFSLGGYNDWRLPTIKELYSLIDFSGEDPSGYEGTDTSGLIPFIDTDYFFIEYGDTEADERIIDSQFASSTKYVSTTMHGDETMFGVNFVDGRIKGYGLKMMEEDKMFFVLYVRNNTSYGTNDFVNNSDGTITDNATGLMWMEVDSGSFDVGINSDGTLNWEEALEWAVNLDYAGYTDWRLPDVKELQSIVDYTRSPDTTNSPAISSVFATTTIVDEGGNSNYGYYWSSTTHNSINGGGNAAYISFGEALGFMTFDGHPPRK